MATEYYVCNGTDPQTLMKNVNDAIKNGWQPIGGVSTLVLPADMFPQGHGGVQMFLQAVIR